MLDIAIDQSDLGGPAAALPPRTYVNHLSLQLALSEICIDLGQAFSGAQGAVTCCRLVTNPTHLVRARGAIDAAISRYQDRFGVIAEGGADG